MTLKLHSMSQNITTVGCPHSYQRNFYLKRFLPKCAIVRLFAWLRVNGPPILFNVRRSLVNKSSGISYKNTAIIVLYFHNKCKVISLNFHYKNSCNYSPMKSTIWVDWISHNFSHIKHNLTIFLAELIYLGF